ncbi:MAG: hypothetical protein NC293_00295 [Roseburia sp.]|nr:hypothetical protein [Roseburia sp.]
MKEEDFKYTLRPSNLIMQEYKEFILVVEHFIELFHIKENVCINRSIIGRICERVDQRRDYYMYFHSEEGTVMHMSQEKEIALWAYWICKYKPIRFEKISDDECFFTEHGCTLSDALAAYMIKCIAEECKSGERVSFSYNEMEDLFYDLANRDFSKEAIISKVMDLIQ